MWLYKDKKIEKLEDFGEPLPFGFVYMITHKSSGKAYIGRKNLFSNYKKKLTKKELNEITGRGRKPKSKQIIKESNWKEYFSSNEELINLSKKEPLENFEKIILTLVFSKKLLTYYETKYLFNYEVLEKPEKFFNRNILSKFYTGDFDGE